jgi:cytochrome c peroxidase
MARPIPPGTEFSVIGLNDPYGCTFLQNPTTGALSLYRRPLPATNLSFAAALIWDEREPDFANQAIDATLERPRWHQWFDASSIRRFQ